MHSPSKITQMILAVLEDWYHHIVLTHSCKLVSFFAYILYKRKCGMSVELNLTLTSWVEIESIVAFKVTRVWKFDKLYEVDD